MMGAFKLILEMGGEGDKEVELPCPKCGEETEADDKYCDDCGATLPVARPTPAKFADARKMAMDKMMAGEGK